MKKQLLTCSLPLILTFLLGSSIMAQAQVLTETFSSIPTTWVQSNSLSSTSANASWKLTNPFGPGYGATGYTDNTGATASYAMWVDGSSPYPCDVSITTDSIDPSTLTAPSLEFYWFKNNTSATYAGSNNTLTVELFDGQAYHSVWSGSTDSAGWRKVQVDMSCFSMPNDIALRFTVSKFNGGASFYNDIVVDDIKVQELPSGYSNCAAPTAIAVGTVTGGAATATVTEGCNTSATTTVIYGLAGFNPSTAGTSVTASSGTASLTSLVSSSTYEAYAVTSCGTSSYSDTLGPVSFITPCAPVATPWTDNLDAVSSGGSTNPSLPVCWVYHMGVSNASIYSTYHYTYGFISNSASNSLRMQRSSSASYSGDSTMSLTPEIQGLDSATKQLEFYGRKGYSTYPGEVIVGVTNAAGDASSLTIVDTVYMNSDAFEKYTVYLDAAAGIASGDARVAFVTVNNGIYDYMYVDDITVKDIPPCPEPIGLSLVGATQTTGTISWSSSSAAFNIEVGPMGFTQGTGTSYSSATTSYTATGLTQNTYYDAYVMANCTSTGDGTSNWVGPFTFKTECGAFTSPYSEDFGYSDGTGSTVNPDLPDCWEHQNLSTYLNNYCYVDKYYYYGNQATDSAYIYLRTYYSAFSTQAALGDTNMVILPRIAGLENGTQQILFNARKYSSFYPSEIAIATIDSNKSHASLSIVDTIQVTTTNTYSDYSLDLDNVASDAAHVVLIAFAGPSGSAYNGAYFDKIEIRDIPNCPVAVNAMGVANSDSSATLTWVDTSAVTNYIIEWGPSGFTQGTGAPTDTVTGTSWSINTLDDATTYDFYIQSNCMSTNGSMSPWVGPITVDVPCSPTAAPFADGFENKPTLYGNSLNPNFPDCWAYSVNSNPGNSYSYASTSSFSAYTGTGYVYNRQSNNAGDTVVVSLPMIEDLNQGGLQIKFWARQSSSFYPGHMSVATTDASGNYSSAVVAKNFNVGSTTYQQYSVYLDSSVVTSDSRRPAFLFYGVSGSYNYIYLDSVEVEAIPACINYNQMASNVTSSSADLTWSYTGTNCFNVEYGPAGFIQGTGVGALSGTLDTNVTGPYSLTGLNPNTGYDFYVQNCCSATWEGPFTFQTECTGPLAAGTYSVGPTGDFATLDSVTSTLSVCGISGAVTFEFQSGSFSTSSYLGEINGSSMTNTITFKGSTSANDTIIAGTDAAFVLEGAKYMNFEDLFVYTPNNSGFRLNGTSDISITGNTIMSNTTSTSSVINGIIASASATSAFSSTVGEQNITIENNDIIGGYYGIRFYGTLTNRNGDIVISENTLTDQYYYGIYIYYADNVEISDNELSDFRSNFAYGIYPYRVDGCQVLGNHISDSYYGIYGYYMSSTSTANAPSEITNNMINAGYYGLGVLWSDSVGVYHNTAVGGYAGVRDYYNVANVNFRNNIFTGGTYALYNYNTSAFADYNLYYSTGTSLGYSYVSSPYAVTYIDSLGQLQGMDSTMHMNSVEGDPIFATATDLHVYGPLANDAGDNTVGVTEDIDGDARPMSGSTTVDIGADEYDVIGDDAALTALLNPANGVCGDDSLMVSVEIANNGQNVLTSLTVSVDIFGTTMTATPTGLSVPFGGKDTVELGYINNLVGGTYSIVAYTQLTGDGRPGNDTLSTSVDVSDAQQVAVNYPAMICSGDDVVMTITHPTEGTVLWLSGNDTLAIAGVDSTITLAGVTMDTTITVGTVSSETEIATPVPGTFTWSGLDGVFFTTSQAGTLDTVSIYPTSTTGSEAINVIDVSTGATIFSTTATWSASGENRIAIGASMPAGNYLLERAGSTSGSWNELYVGTGATGYPFWSTDSNAVLTGGTYSGYIEYFFDWKFTIGGCEREDSTFTVSIHPDAVAAISVDTANATISATDWMANWSTAGTTGADSIYVEFSNGTSSNDTSGTVTFNANNAGETVTVIAFGACSSDTATFTFDVNQISVDEDFLNGTLSIYPNPTRGLFNVEFATATATNVEISIVNMVGQVISNEIVTVNGLYNNQFDLSNESAGVYFIKFTTDEGVLTERITVE